MNNPARVSTRESSETSVRRFTHIGRMCHGLIFLIIASTLYLLAGPMWRVGQAIVYAEIRGPRLERLHGFDVATPVLKLEEGYREVPVIRADPGGFMQSAGFGDCDVILSHTRAEFYKMLYNCPGQTEKVEVVNVVDLDAPVPRSKARTLEFTVPSS